MTSKAEQAERILLERIAQEDAAALKQLYMNYRPRLHRFLTTLGCSPADLDEAVNETFFVVWRKARQFTGKSRVSTWVFGIARNKGLKLCERRSRQAGRQSERPLESLVDPAAGVSGSEELRQWLDVGLAMLPSEQRQVLELTFMEGMSVRDIATLMECPESTVKTRMFHARRKLRDILPSMAAARQDEIPDSDASTTGDTGRK